MTTALLDTTWSIGRITFNGMDATGTEWWVETDDGWFNAPGEVLSQEVWPSYDGVFDAPSYRDKRLITLSGTVLAPDRYTCDQALRTLAAVGMSRALVPLTVAEPQRTYTVGVRRAQAPTVTRVTANAAEWQLFLVAPDPRRYWAQPNTATALVPSVASGLDWSTGGGLNWSPGLDWGTATSTGTATVANPGTAESWPIFTLTGPLLYPVITNPDTGQVIAFNGTLGVADTLVITTSPYGRTVILNGSTDRRSWLTSAQWFSASPEGMLTVALSTSSSADTGQLAVSVYPADW